MCVLIVPGEQCCLVEASLPMLSCGIVIIESLATTLKQTTTNLDNQIAVICFLNYCTFEKKKSLGANILVVYQPLSILIAYNTLEVALQWLEALQLKHDTSKQLASHLNLTTQSDGKTSCQTLRDSSNISAFR